ncbi:MAG: TetR/AcrR family transcriptional regulator [Acidimicrobiales bacterium]
MPRISEATIAEHVARQEKAVFTAAVGLFVERGYSAVSLADIAAAVGLARNSLYRYFPDKAHIFLRWFRSELAARAERSAELAGAAGSPSERLTAWVLDQLDYAQRPEHGLLAAFAGVAAELDEATRRELAESHLRLFAPLNGVLADARVDGPAARDLAVNLIGGMVLAASGHEARQGVSTSERARVVAAVVAVVSSMATSGQDLDDAAAPGVLA